MALIGTIRKNFWFVLIVLGVALASFVIMDMVGANGPQAGLNPSMGEVAGTPINYQEFNSAQNALYSNSGADPYAVQNTLWNFFVEKALVSEEADDLGMKISREELMDLQFGDNLSPVIQQNFRDQTGQINRTNLQSFKDAIENGEFTNPGMRAFWAEQEKQIVKTQLQTKLSQMVSKGIYTPTWMLEESHKGQNATVDFNFVKIPFTQIPDAEVQVTDNDIQNYISSNSALFKKDQETRSASYVVYDVIASPEDSVLRRSESSQLLTGLQSTDNVEQFVTSNQGVLAPIYFSQSELPEGIRDVVPGMNVGDTYGPYLDNGTYSVVRLMDKRTVADSVEARHILRRADQNDPVSVAAAQAYADSLLNVIRSGGNSFAELAKVHSEDQGSGAQGGDLGTFGQGRMVPEFNDYCFYDGDEGDYGTVVTQFTPY